MPGHNMKPDFLDMDGDGDKQEPMKEMKAKERHMVLHEGGH